MAVYIIYKRLALDFPRVRDYNVGRLICVKEERKMKIHKNNATHRGVSKRSTYFLLYTATFLICSACIYVWFARTGRSLISTGDGWKQHFPAFVYFGQYGRTVLRTLLTEHQLVLPQWNFSLGYGGDILTTLHYYVIGDPLDLLSIACPTRYAVYLYSFLSLFRLYLAGLGFGAFCRYKKQGAPLPVAVGSVCYVFFTYSFLLVARHPFFALPMVYLPLLLLGVEQVLAKRRPYLLIVTVFLAAVSNFYFFYMLAIITAIYTVYRLCCLYDRHRHGRRHRDPGPVQDPTADHSLLRRLDRYGRRQGSPAAASQHHVQRAGTGTGRTHHSPDLPHPSLKSGVGGERTGLRSLWRYPSVYRSEKEKREKSIVFNSMARGKE